MKPQYLIGALAKRPLQPGQVVFVPAVVEACAPPDAINPHAVTVSVLGRGSVPLLTDEQVYAIIGDTD